MNTLRRLAVTLVVVLLQSGCAPDQEWYEKNIIIAGQQMQNGDYNSAIKIYDTVLAEDPYYPPANYGKGAALLALYQKGGMEAPPPRNLNFLPYLKKAADSVPENAHYGVTYALIASQIEGCESALEYFNRQRNRLDQTVTGSPSFGVYYSYIKCLLEVGEKEKAVLVANEYEGKVKLMAVRKNAVKEIEAINSLFHEGTE